MRQLIKVNKILTVCAVIVFLIDNCKLAVASKLVIQKRPPHWRTVAVGIGHLYYRRCFYFIVTLSPAIYYLGVLRQHNWQNNAGNNGVYLSLLDCQGARDLSLRGSWTSLDVTMTSNANSDFSTPAASGKQDYTFWEAQWSFIKYYIYHLKKEVCIYYSFGENSWCFRIFSYFKYIFVNKPKSKRCQLFSWPHFEEIWVCVKSFIVFFKVTNVSVFSVCL